MKTLITAILLFFTLPGRAQDFVYLLNGSKTTGKITEVGTEDVAVLTDGATERIPRAEILLLEFRNGTTEIINQPRANVTASARPGKISLANNVNELPRQNLISFNSLALINADVSCFYERINKTKEIGFGIMGAYNINPRATIYTPHIFILSNARKLYDLGLFMNYYPKSLNKTRSFYVGLFFKYTAINFSSLSEDTVMSGGVKSVLVSYKAAEGHQLATLFSIGKHYRITNSFFVKTLFSIGGFNLKGDYKKQYNFMSNRGNPAGTLPVERTLLLKWYFGLNAGYYF